MCVSVTSTIQFARAAGSRIVTGEKSEMNRESNKQPEASSNIFQSGGGTQSVAQGDKPIGTQINNYYYAPLPQAAKPQPALSVKTEPQTVIVDAMHRGDYATITDALKVVKAGARILVRPGLYKEGIIIDKPVEIIGEGDRNEIVIEGAGRCAIVFVADNGRVSNLTLRQVGSDDWYGVDIAQGRLEIEDCDISSQGHACVAIHSNADPRLRRNHIHNGNGVGVVVYKNGRGTLEDNNIFANEENGVAITTGGSLILRRNHISQNGAQGVWVSAGGGGIFENNDLRGNTGRAWYIELGCEARVQRRGNKE